MAKHPSLLEAARAPITTPKSAARGFSPEELELAEAWLNGELELQRVSTALKKCCATNAYIFLARAARELWRRQP